MSNNLYEANKQWSTRPDDERFESLPAMHAACLAYAKSAIHAKAPLNSLTARAAGDDVLLVGKTGTAAKVSHYAFGQLSRFAEAPAGYLRTLPAELAATCINTGLAKRDDDVNLLFHKNGSLVTRALTSEKYDRVWNYEITARIQKHLADEGWQVPPARPARYGQRGTRKATAADILPNQKEFGLSVKVGDDIAPAGLYASDHDMFAFLVQQSEPVWDGAKFLNRGVFIQNSEVGDCALKFVFFTYDNVCGNHIVWGATNVTKVSARHVKRATADHGNTLQTAFEKWHVLKQSMPNPDETAKGIAKAKAFEVKGTRDEVLDAFFGFAKKKGLSALSRGALDGAYAIAESTPRYGNPNTVWSMVNGLTEYSQKVTAYADERNAIDTQAGRLMEMAF